MTKFYFFLGLFFLLTEALVIASPKKFTRGVINLKAKGKLPAGTHLSLTEFAYILVSLFYIIWCGLGLLTDQWIIFLGILSLSLIPKGKYWFLYQMDAIISFLLILFAILNQFHFKINLFNLIFP